uniref:Integrase, catalytic region, zinc finger, CCHC-type, peptidase aspartic, catalytic n=1 Tax=Tanacetum cinerariifolium TaxID=118510 RepID=A0A699H4I1_TANCI|nr:integrase, catalytic region, zinc finger, CCHC-type, peptidase aspartic, catalytic [Tanacetum cinerariifolium]
MTTPNVTASTHSQMHNNIMAAGSRDRPPMLAIGRYPQWRSRFLRCIDTRPNGEALRKCILSVETPMNMSPENKAQFEAEKEAIHLILTGIGDEIYSTIYKPTNKNLRTSSNSRNKNVDSTPRYKNDDQSGQFRNQRTANVAGVREKVGSPVVQQSRIQCFNCKEYGHFAKECRKPKRVKDSAYHKEKMLLCKQAKQAHYNYMAKIQEVPTADSGTNSEPLEQVQTDARYNVFASDLQHSEQSESISNTCSMETDDSSVITGSPNMCEGDIQNDQNDVESDDEHIALANLIANLKLDTKQTEFEKYKAFNNRTIDYDKLKRKLNETLGQLAQKHIEIKEGLKTKAYELSVVKEKHDELVKQILLTESHYEGLVKQKIKVITDLKLREEHDIDKMLSMEKQLKFLNETVYKRSQSIQTIHMMAPKTQNDSFRFVHELKQEMHADLKCYVLFLMSLSDLDALDELQCLYLHKLKECDCLAQKLSNQTEYLSKEVHSKLLKRVAKVEKHSFSLEIALQKRKEQGKSVDTKFDRPSVVRQPNAQRIPKPSVLGKPTPFSNSLKRIYFSKTRSVPKANVSEGLSKPVTARTLPQTGRKVVSNTNVLKPGMYQIDNRKKQTRAPQLPQTVRNTNPCVSTSTGVNHKTNVSRPQPKSDQSIDKVQPNNSQVKVKKTKLEVHPRIPSVSNKMKSVTACKDSLNSITLNANAICATCNKCLVDSNHFACVTKMLNDVHARTKKPNVVPISTRKPKSQVNKSVATSHKKKIVQLIIFIVDSGCTKHMTGNLKLLCNFVEKFLGTVRFGNDQFAPILSYGDLVQGNVTINRVYYIDCLNHNLFSVGQFCDADLEVAFQKSTCFVRDLQGNNLLTDVHVPSQQELDLLFGSLYDEFFNAEEGEQLQDDKFTNPFCAPPQEEAESSSHNIDLEICMFALTVSTAEPKNIKEAMADYAWIEAMHEELHQFDKLQEVYVAQPDRLVDPDHPEKVYRLRKALYGLKQALRVWYDELSKFLTLKGFTKGQSIGTPMAMKPKLDAYLNGNPVDQTDYRSKIWSLMYLTSSRPDIVQAGSSLELTAFSDADHAGCINTRKSTSGGIQFLGDKLVSWMSKK